MTDALTSASSVREWLADPVGGPLLRDALAAMGSDPGRIGPIAGYPLAEFAGFSRGAMPDDAVADLVRAANGGVLVAPPDDGPRDGVRTLDDIQMRDPFLLVDGDTHWLFGTTDRMIWFGPGTGFDAYSSADLESWHGPVAAFRPPTGFWATTKFWAPEVHAHAGCWFLFATFTRADGHMGTAALVSDAPEGPYEPWSDGPLTPERWQCLDGTLHVDDAGDPWLVFCHEWTQVHDGEVWAQRLAPDLSRAEGVPVFLFSASEATWARPLDVRQTGETRYPAYVTDGPFLVRLDGGHLLMLWSSFGEAGYAMGVAHSASGHVTGPWTQEDEPLWAADGGHGMIARLPAGDLVLTLHQPNSSPDERPVLRRLRVEGDTVRLAD
ncbi:MAG: glycoside hydrolase family 43 protein [Propionibacteriaceae bacterium]|nr:glycoside hydrolase family 43 protein [Propionibacteriaceae bacterium]